MALVPLGEQQITITKDGVDQTNETVTQGDNIELLDYINNHGTATINGPNDTLNGQGYYSSISNSITDQGSLNNVTPGNSEPSGYYASGTIPKESQNLSQVGSGSGEATEVDGNYKDKRAKFEVTLDNSGIVIVSAYGVDANDWGQDPYFSKPDNITTINTLTNYAIFKTVMKEYDSANTHQFEINVYSEDNPKCKYAYKAYEYQ